MRYKLLIILALVVFFSYSSFATIVSFEVDFESVNHSQVKTNPIRSSDIILEVKTDIISTCKYSLTKGRTYSNMENSFESSFNKIHRTTITRLEEGTQKYYIRCKNLEDNISPEIEAIFYVNLPVTARISLSKSSPLSAGEVEVTLTTSKILSQPPSLSYSFDGISYDPIPVTGSGKNWKGYLVIPPSKREGVVSFNFQGRDLEGFSGNEITQGKIFLIDTVPPETITEIKAQGHPGMIQLDWHLQNQEKVKEYKIYRSESPGVGKSDYYQTTRNNEFKDTSVTRGKTYYYRVSAIDYAGNKGSLSIEVYSTVLLEEIDETIESGLNLAYHSLVDNMLVEIDNIEKETSNNKESLKKEYPEISNHLNIERDIQSVSSEISSLRREVENFKKQSLTKQELENKLDSSRLKLNVIKRRIPESVIIHEETSLENTINEEEIYNIIFELYPEYSERRLNQMTKKSLEFMEESNFNIKTTAYNLEIIYIDGSRNQKSIIIQEISGENQNNEVLIIDYFPAGKIATRSELKIQNNNFKVLKENPIISFNSNEKEIVYTLDKKINLENLKEMRTLLVHEVEEEIKRKPLTGYISFAEITEFNNSGTIGIIITLILVASLLTYFIYFNKKTKMIEKIIPLKQRVNKVKKEIENKNFEQAKKEYEILKKEYSTLNKSEKKEIIKEISLIQEVLK